MVFRDESAGKTPQPTEKSKKDCKKKRKIKKERNNKKIQPVTNEILWKKKSIFF
jgi:hypothetical protein